MSRSKRIVWYWVAYPEGVEKVQLIEEGVGARKVKRGLYTKPVTVENEDGDEFIVSSTSLHHSPIEASVEVAKIRKSLGLSEQIEDDLEKNPLDDIDDSEEDEDPEDDDSEEDED